MSDPPLLALDELDFIEEAYFDALGRPADPQGLFNVLQRLRAGLPRAALLAELRSSHEALERHHRLDGRPTLPPNLMGTAPGTDAASCTLDQLLAADDEDFVRLAYLRLLGRAADREGLTTYLQRLRQGVPRELLLNDVARSEEGLKFGAHLEGLASAAADARKWTTRVPRWLRRWRGGATPAPIHRPVQAAPSRQTTLVVSYARAGSSVVPERAPAAATAWGRAAVRLEHDGRVQTAQLESQTLEQVLADDGIRHVLLLEDDCTPHADFWALFDKAWPGSAPGTQVWLWPSLQPGRGEPQAVLPPTLLDPVFVGHPTLPILSAVLEKSCLLSMHAASPGLFHSGSLCLEQALAASSPLRVSTLSTPLDQNAGRALPAPSHRGAAPARSGLPGLSVILSCGTCIDDSLGSLLSVQGQTQTHIEVVLVRGAMASGPFGSLIQQARLQFGQQRVQTVDSDDTACDVRLAGAGLDTAARLARHELLLLLQAGTCVPLSPALDLAGACAQLPWVGTVGFASAGAHADGDPGTLQATQETSGNRLSATLVRRSVWLSIGVPDTLDVPPLAMDVDFCQRASRQGLRHIRLGGHRLANTLSSPARSALPSPSQPAPSVSN